MYLEETRLYITRILRRYSVNNLYYPITTEQAYALRSSYGPSQDKPKGNQRHQKKKKTNKKQTNDAGMCNS